jgi:hypothetical protein
VRDEEDAQEHPEGRIRNTGKLLTAAAPIMSFFLLTTSFITVVLIPPEELSGGAARIGRLLTWRTATWATLAQPTT